ncbi:putative fructokinase GmuE [Paenibacillus larvae subsp. larvae]|uniref:fructokinase n=2 Tax=Paenibacillus larvae TaxID=1464 RepID=A0A1U9YQK6_9BACL|nr:ROK family protein [Paenibacillus larvae]AQT86117.1 fructokinase [Paenibacillus larvae subsp. pulvifaciens]AQZ47727.1 fructokinase [Paenibacillus larvae subsp. pulvifaciens]ARF69429.1 fructokinase [Paenibacillus larvae subsp. pulvifaciens]AVF25603.1 putative fructokinase GmuE [Paenibacillus larvae subsp. larvae]AVF30380.1 putative fructokinase GmuE [Paenibacillus larvae subsp. larvae]
MKLLGAVEAGGTKFVCGVGTADGQVVDRVSFPTTTPEETMKRVIDYFKTKDISAMGVGSFGPVDPRKDSPTYGYITSTPKPHWGGYNLLGELKKHFNVPMEFDTDVNGAALGEAKFGAARGLLSCMYITVGTGIGAGALVDGKLVHGLSHPEMGHILVRRHPEDTYEGKCPYHKDCLEGLAAGPSIEARWSVKGSELSTDHPAWEMIAYYLAQAMMNYILILSPEKMIMGGGVMKQKQLFPLIHRNLIEILNGYIQNDAILKNIEEYIVYPELGDHAGLCGALALAALALES